MPATHASQHRGVAVPALATARRRSAAGTFTRLAGSGVRREGRPCLPAARRTEEIDSAVLAAAAAGDDEAFIAVMRHYDRRLRIVAYHVLGRPPGDGRRAPGGLAAGVPVAARLPRRLLAGDLAVPHHVPRLRATPLARSARLVPVAAGRPAWSRWTRPDPADDVATRLLLAEAFASLPPDQRLAVLLVDREGYDYATTAEILGVPPGTLASRLNAARGKLRRFLGPSLEREVQ